MIFKKKKTKIEKPVQQKPEKKLERKNWVKKFGWLLFRKTITASARHSDFDFSEFLEFLGRVINFWF